MLRVSLNNSTRMLKLALPVVDAREKGLASQIVPTNLEPLKQGTNTFRTTFEP